SVERAPTVSVLLPVHNGARYLSVAVQSVLSQTFKDFELLVMDDGSTDESLAILWGYERIDPRVKAYHTENKGVSSAINSLINLARGKYLARMDADDCCLPARLKAQLKFLEQHPDHVAVGSWVQLMTEGGLPIGTLKLPIKHEEIDRLNLEGHVSLAHPSVMMRASALDASDIYSPQFEVAEDLDLWLRLAEVGKLANLPEVLLKYRLTADSLSVRGQDKGLSLVRFACEEAYRRRGIKGRTTISKHWRPSPDRNSLHEYAVRYGWMAWSNNYRQTWRHFVRQALELRPFAVSTWRLIVFGWLKRPSARDE
ncbi:MAG TPA: glycosyltransferase, partial [Verrucomicrobiae bacterium]|nr:glycosyltransferase [Verrucomicrobiae bacterium]